MKIFLASIFFFATVAAQSPIPPNAALEKIATGFEQPEGPIWIDSLGLLFSDIRANIIYRWSDAESIKIFLKPSDSSNGLTLDRQGRLILTQMELRRVARREADGAILPLTSTYNGKKYNSPNDVVVKSDGSIFFTDPDFNIPIKQDTELTFKGVYRISPSGTVQLLDTTFNEPNGICFSPDEKHFYVNESKQCKIYVWDVINDSTIANKKLFYSIPASGYADGMKTDMAGNIYCAGPTGVWIVSPSGKSLGKIAMTETPSNCNWGDTDRKSLYITAGASLYRIRLTTTGVRETNPSEGTRTSPNPEKFELYPNYPNPFNPMTNLRITIGDREFVRLEIFDYLGREVETLMNGEKDAGSYSVPWDGSEYSSGVYFCRLLVSPVAGETEDFIETTKMILMK